MAAERASDDELTPTQGPEASATQGPEASATQGPEASATQGSLLERARRAVGRATEAVTPSVEGEELLSADGGALLAFNHLAPVDRIRLRIAGRRVRFVHEKAHRGADRSSSPSGTTGGLPVDGSLDRAVELLQAGELVGVFPEGERSPDGRLYRGGDLVARIALASRAPLLPVATLPPEGLMDSSIAPRLVVGEELDIERFADWQDPAAERAVTDLVMDALMVLSGQVYMDVDAATRRDQLGEHRRARSAALKAEAKARRTAEIAAQQQRIADRQAEQAELARIQADAAQAAREHARRAAEADAWRKQVRATRMPQVPARPPRDLREPHLHDPS